MSDRGQTFTLEAFLAAVILLSALTFALQALALSSTSTSVAGAERRDQHVGIAEGVLDQTVANGSLESTLLYWDELGGRFYGTSPLDGHYVGRPPPTPFGTSLRAAFDRRQVRYNVDLYFPTRDGERGHQPLVESGTPSDDAVRVLETVTLYDRTRLVDANGSRRSVTLADVAADGNRTFYAPDVQPAGPLYSVVRVEVVVWQA